MKPRLLLTGCSGFLGWNFCQAQQHHWQIHGLSRYAPDKLPASVKHHRLDITDSKQLIPCFNHIKPDAVIHLAALSSPNQCQQQPAVATRINVDASQQLAELCAGANIPMVFASSSQVYDGLTPPYDEYSDTLPCNAYGQQKLAAEQAVSNAWHQATICRLPLMFGAVPAGRETFLQTIVRACINAQDIFLFTDEYRMFLGAQSAVAGLLLALQHPKECLLLAGNERLSRYEFGQRVADFYKLDKQRLIACRQKDVAMAAQRPGDLLLLNKKAKSLGFSPLSLEQELAAMSLPALF